MTAQAVLKASTRSALGMSGSITQIVAIKKARCENDYPGPAYIIGPYDTEERSSD